MTSASEASSSTPAQSQATTAPGSQSPVFPIACLALAVVVSLPALLLISRIWSRSEFYGHGYLIPFCSLALLYTHREELLAALRSATPPLIGPLLVLGAATLQMLFVLGDVVFAAGLSVPLLLGVTAYALGGRALLAHFHLPLGLLVFMVPPPGFVTLRLLFGLKLFVTDFSVALLQNLGFVIASQGNLILLPGHTLFVADACSGLTSIVTLTPLAVVVACFLLTGWVRRILLVASVLPLAVGANILRVTGTVAFVSHLGEEYAHGLLHDSFGMTTYVLGTLALVGLARVLR